MIGSDTYVQMTVLLTQIIPTDTLGSVIDQASVELTHLATRVRALHDLCYECYRLV